MSSFPFELLLLPTAIIFLLTLALSYYVTKAPGLSIFLAFVKASIFLLYFGFYFDGTFTFSDDLKYLDGGQQLFWGDVGVTDLIEEWPLLLAIGDGQHFLYYLFNSYSFIFFGQGYYAPVALNVLLTVLIAYLGTCLTKFEFAINKQASKWFYIFLLLHPDILAWSNVMNGKDVVVLFLHLLLLSSISLYLQNQHLKSILLGGIAIISLFFLRFYVPIIFATALVVSFTLTSTQHRLRYLFSSILFLVMTSLWIGVDGLEKSLSSIGQNFSNPIYGFVRMLLIPIPFNTDKNYAFLDLSATLHWMLLPFAVIGFLRICQFKTAFSRFFIVYLFFFFLLYSVFMELQEPRHRIQMDYGLAVLQFLGMMSFKKYFIARSIR